MPEGFDYEAALKRAANPRELTPEERRRVDEEIVPAVRAAQGSEEQVAKDLETGKKLLQGVETNKQRLEQDLDGYGELQQAAMDGEIIVDKDAA